MTVRVVFEDEAAYEHALAEAREQGAREERLRLLRLYTADALTLGWSADTHAAIRRRLVEPES